MGVVATVAVATLLLYCVLAYLCSPTYNVRVRLVVKLGGLDIMASAITVVETHAPLQITAVYVNAKGNPVSPQPTPASPVFTLSDPSIASQSPSGVSDVVSLLKDGAVTVSYSDGTFSDTLPITVTPDQNVAGVQLQVSNL